MSYFKVHLGRKLLVIATDRRCFVGLILFFIGLLSLQAQDLPNPPPNIETLVANSYIIPMDNEHQSIEYVPSQQGPVYEGFNLKAYGLVYQILDYGIPVKWVIRSGKDKDDPDIEDEAYQIAPVTSAPSFQQFRGSAFVVDLNDLIESAACNPNNPEPTPDIETLISDYGNNVAVYRNSDEINIDVRYNLRLAPKVAVMSDGNYDYEQTEILDMAGIPHSVLSNQEFFETAECFTFVSQPHIEEEAVDANYVNVLSAFVQNGGNFFAQCVGLLSYENLALYQTTEGFEGIDDYVSNASYWYLNDDLAIMQFDGDFPDNINGMTGSYGLAPGSSWKTNAYRAITVGNPSNGEILLSGADINGPNPGGNMIYCGGHAFNEGVIIGELPEITYASRIFLNAAFIPANINFACAGSDVCICPGESIVLGCADPLNGVSFSWSPPTGLSCTNCPNPIASPKTTTTYTMTPSQGFCGESTVTVTVYEDSPMGTNVIADCTADESTYTITFEITGGDPSSYVVIGDGTLSGNTFVSAPIAAGAAYSFEVKDDAGCSYFVEGRWYCCDALATLSGGGEICSSGGSTFIQVDLLGAGDWIIVYAIDGVAQPPITTDVTPYIIEADEPGVYSLVSITDADCRGNTGGVVSVDYAQEGYAGRNVNLSICYNARPRNIVSLMNNPDNNGNWSMVSGNPIGAPFDFATGIFDPYLQEQDTLIYYHIVPGGNCPADTAQVTLSIIDCPCVPPKEPTIIEDQFVFCGEEASGEIKFAIEGGNRSVALWYDSPTLDSAIHEGWDFRPDAPGTYYAHTINVPDDGCRSNVYPFLFAVVDRPYVQTISDTTLYRIAPIRLSTWAYSNHSTIADFYWEDELGLLEGNTELSPVISPNATNTYTITVTDELGCTNTTAVTITFVNNLYIPNVFTPNFDGLNDVFRPYSHSVAHMSMKVYSRTGSLVYGTETDDIRNGWDGTFRGKRMNPGVFVYILELTFFDGEKVNLSGDVTLLK